MPKDSTATRGGGSLQPDCSARTSEDKLRIELGIDDTDHVAFFCPQCDAAMKVTGVKTEKVLVNTNTGKHDKCTWIHCACPKHGNAGWRKFYWTVEDGAYCRHRTDAKPCNDKLTGRRE